MKAVKLEKVVIPIKTKLERHRTALFALSVILLFAFVISAATTKSSDQIESVAPNPNPVVVGSVVFGASEQYQQAVGVVKNETTIALVAQTAGPVSKVYAQEGERVKKGGLILQQETAYNSGQASFISLEIANKNRDLASEALWNTTQQTDLLRKQTEESFNNSEKLREIAEKSRSETAQIVDLLEKTVKNLEDSIEEEKQNNNDPEVIQNLENALIGPKSNLLQTRSQLRALELQSSEDGPQADISSIAKEIAFKSIDLQQKSVETQYEIAKLNVRMAQIAAAAARVTAPIDATIERITVKKGQYLTPGTPVAIVNGGLNLTLEIQVAPRLASEIDLERNAVIQANSGEILLPITYVSTVPVTGSLHIVSIDIPQVYYPAIYESMALGAKLPIKPNSSSSSNEFIPIDGLFITNTDRFVFVYDEGFAKKKVVETGNIIGDAIEIKSGINKGERVIIDRRVVDLQAVTLEEGN